MKQTLNSFLASQTNGWSAKELSKELDLDLSEVKSGLESLVDDKQIFRKFNKPKGGTRQAYYFIKEVK